ncbi:CPBP family intramembrane glutamic endopeptidase [Nocardioides sp. W7]|uniref:CPBP family intramembrane glutamic endopeptidase n=1 Tax=Nocardioides sp. W7 TaxID=2931390 RepID=UPI001FD03AA4|nr:CPBP family intramembrane glutamic endopeptidase [Nocardioides sp. W7]
MAHQALAPPLLSVAAILVVTDLVLLDQDRWTVLVSLAATAALLVTARRAGLGRAGLGLDPACLGRGLLWGAVPSAVIGAGLVAAALLPALEAAFADGRTPDRASEVALKVLVVIPLRTVLLEELAFRGVLWGLVAERRGPRAATWWSSAAFGLWHLPTAFVVLETNDALQTASESVLGTVAVVVGIVVATGASGLLFAELRRRSGSLLAPALVHWTTNAGGTVVGFLLG